MEVRKTKERLEQQAKERREKLKANKKQEMTKEEFNEKWTLPAYLRRGVKVDNDVPHSSEPFISRYNLNDDNNLLGNNKFLHDNVDWNRNDEVRGTIDWSGQLVLRTSKIIFHEKAWHIRHDWSYSIRSGCWK